MKQEHGRERDQQPLPKRHVTPTEAVINAFAIAPACHVH